MYNVCALYNQLSEQGLVAYTEMQMPLLGGLLVHLESPESLDRVYDCHIHVI